MTLIARCHSSYYFFLTLLSDVLFQSEHWIFLSHVWSQSVFFFSGKCVCEFWTFPINVCLKQMLRLQTCSWRQSIQLTCVKTQVMLDSVAHSGHILYFHLQCHKLYFRWTCKVGAALSLGPPKIQTVLTGAEVWSLPLNVPAVLYLKRHIFQMKMPF